MNRGFTLRIAARALWEHRVRTALTSLSVMLGCAAIVLMSSLSRSGFQTLRRGIEEMGGARLLIVAPKQPERELVRARAYQRGLNEADAEHAFGQLPHVSEYSLYANLGTKDIVSDTGTTGRADFVAADESFLRLYGLKLAQGRPFDAHDVERHARSCVVGHATAQSLWRGAALERLFTIAGVHCRVVGQLSATERPGVELGFSWQDLVVVPRTAALERLPGVREASLIIAKTDAPSSNELVKRTANVLLSARHHGIDDFTFFDFQRILSRFYLVFTLMEVLAGCLAGVALVIGGIGIMNMMWVSVAERQREIGIRKALGARPRDIRAQFLLEAALLSGLAGGVGVSLGLGAALAVSALVRRFLQSWVAGVSAQSVLIAWSSAIAIGMAFGWLPARQASVLSAAEAMRRC